jgi:hypothetical protein
MKSATMVGSLERLHLVDGDDAGMPQLSGGSRLAMEALQVHRRGEQAGVRNLEGHDPVEFRVARLPDRAKGPQAHPLQELELAQRPHG